MSARVLKQLVILFLLVSVLLPAVPFLPPAASIAFAQEPGTEVIAGQQNQNLHSKDPAQATTPESCSVISVFGGIHVNCLVLNMVRYVTTFLNKTILALASLILDWSIGYNLNPTTLLENTAFVKVGWGLIRDVTNLFFIFILLWIALATIFDIPQYGAKSLLGKLIIAALLINFSLAIGSFVIHLTDALAREFYSATVQNDHSIGDQLVAASNIQVISTTKFDLSDPKTICTLFAKQALKDLPDITSQDRLYKDGYNKCLGDPKTQNQFINDMNTNGLNGAIDSAISQQLWLLLILPILAFTLIAGAIFLLIRYLMLSILLIFAPAVFLLWILPDTRSQWSQWWNRLLKWSFFAPAFFFMLFLTTKTYAQLAAQNVAQNKDFFSTGFDMFLLIALMIANIMVAQSFGIYGASAVTRTGKRMAGWTQKKVRGAAYRGAIRGMAPAAQQFQKSGVGQWMARHAITRPLARPAETIQTQRDKIDQDRAARVLSAVRVSAPEYGAARLSGENVRVRDAVYKSARPEDIRRIMAGLTTPEEKDAAGNVTTPADRSRAIEEIVRVRSRDPKLAEKIETAVDDIELKVVAAKGVGLGKLSPAEQAVWKGKAAGQPTQKMAAYQTAVTAYLSEQSLEQLRKILTAKNIQTPEVMKYIAGSFGNKEARALAGTAEQIRALSKAIMQIVQQARPQEFQQHKDTLVQQGNSESKAEFLAMQKIVEDNPRVIQQEKLRNWILGAAGESALYRGIPERKRGERTIIMNPQEPPPPQPT